MYTYMIILHARITQYFIVFALFPRPSLQASSHRGGDRYRTVDRQCTFNPLIFLLMTVKKDVEDWTSETLDRILRNDDWLCINTNLGESQYPLVTDINQQVWVDGQQYDVTMTYSHYESLYIQLEDEYFTTIFDALDMFQYRCILTFGNRTPGYSCGLIKKESCVYLFDPHSRDICGMPLDNGKATQTFHDKNVLPSFIVRLGKSLHAGHQFELTPLETKTVSASLEADIDKNRDLICYETDDSDPWAYL